MSNEQENIMWKPTTEDDMTKISQMASKESVVINFEQHGQHVSGDQYNVGGDIYITTPPKSAKALYQLRAPVSNFVGRERDIAQLTQLLMHRSETASVCGLRGMGGVGKTELALVVANHIKEQYTDGQLMLSLSNLSEPILPEHILQSVIRAFEPQAWLPDDLSSLIKLYRTCLNGKRVLVVADDAKDTEQVRHLLPPAGCALLVTSRHTLNLPGMTWLDLGPLSEAEASKLLQNICPRIGEQAPELAWLYGYLPLALCMAATSLQLRPDRSVTHHIQNLRDERTRAASLHEPTNLSQNVYASLMLSYAALSSPAQATLAQIAVFSGDFALKAAEAVVIAQEHNIADLLDELHLNSMLEYHTGTARYKLNELVRAFALSQLEAKDEGYSTRMRHAKYYARAAWESDQLFKAGNEAMLKGLMLFDQERQQIDAVWKWLMKRDTSDPQAISILFSIANATAHIGALRYDPRRERVPQLEAHVAGAQRLGHRNQESIALGNLGLVYYGLGDYRSAIAYHEQSLAIKRELGDRQSESHSLENLGLTYQAAGNYFKAIAYYEQQLALARELGDQHAVYHALGRLGRAYFRIDHTRPIFYYEQQLALAREIGDRRGEGYALGNIGHFYTRSDRPRAIAALKQKLVIMGELGDRHGENDALSSLGYAHNYYLCDYPEAINYYTQQLTLARKMGDRSREGDALGNLGSTYNRMGDHLKAVDCYERQLALVREMDAQLTLARKMEDHSREGDALGNLGSTYNRMGDHLKAVDCYERQLALAREIGDQRREGDALSNLGSTYNHMGDRLKAIDYYEQRLALAREIGDYRNEGNALSNLGDIYHNLGDYSKAIDHYEQQLALAREVSDQSSEGKALSGLGGVYREIGNASQAMVYYEQALAVKQASGDEFGTIFDSIYLERLQKEQGHRQRSWWQFWKQ